MATTREVPLGYRTYSVSRRDREPLLRWIVGALEDAGCRMLGVSEPELAPFRITFETPWAERRGIVVYAFLANSRVTKNRPLDEHRFQLKYGPDDKQRHELWQDPFGLYTTLLIGINLERGFFVAADPAIHSPTRFYISLEFKERDVQDLLHRGWHSWERAKRDRRRNEYPIEVLVGGTRGSFLRLVELERLAQGFDPGHRQLLAEKLSVDPRPGSAATASPREAEPHALVEELELDAKELLDLIGSAPRLKMAVRGWVAEEHLHRQLLRLPGVEDCVRLEGEGGADLRLTYRGSRPLRIECKNVLRQRTADGSIRLDFQRTRSSKADPCSRFYAPSDFEVVAACLHSATEAWEFRFAGTDQLPAHQNCAGKLDHRVRLDQRWSSEVESVLAAAAGRVA